MRDGSKRKVKTVDLAEMTYDWSEIRHFFIWRNRFKGKNCVVSIHDDGTMQLAAIEGKQSYKEYAALWQGWKAATLARNHPGRHCFPTQIRLRECVALMIFDVVFKILVVALLSYMAFTGEYRKGLITAIYLVSLLALCMLPDLYRQIRRERVAQVSLVGDKLRLVFYNGDLRDFSFSDMKYYSFNPELVSSFVVFEDGTRVTGMHWLSDWPLLREQLLLRLKHSGKPLEVHDKTCPLISICIYLLIGVASGVGLALTAKGAAYENVSLAGIFCCTGAFSLLVLGVRLWIWRFTRKYAEQKESDDG